jgi:hypothetical protein
MKTNLNFWWYYGSRLILLGIKSFSDKVCRENQNKHFIFNNSPPPPNHTVYEIMWKNILQLDTPQMTRRMRFACLINEARDTESSNVILITFLQQQWLRESASVLRYTYIACLIYITKRMSIKFRKPTNFILIFNLNSFVSTSDKPVLQHWLT